MSSTKSQLPPGQQLAAPGKWPLVGERESAPRPDPWTVSISGCVETPITWTLDELRSLPQIERRVDIHCVTRWSLFQAPFTGVALADLVGFAKPTPAARFISFVAHSTRQHSTSLVLSEALQLETLVALSYDGRPISMEHGGPVRAIVPHRYFYKSVKWLNRLELLHEDRLGFWEATAGYHNHADPLLEERFIATSITKQEARQIFEQRDIAGRELLGIDGSHRDLTRLIARGSLLRNANFQRAILREACFERANLSNARFNEADLRGASFVGADLEGANFEGADLRGADLRDASLFGATFVSNADEPVVRQAKIDQSTQFNRVSVDALAPRQAEFVRRTTKSV